MSGRVSSHMHILSMPDSPTTSPCTRDAFTSSTSRHLPINESNIAIMDKYMVRYKNGPHGKPWTENPYHYGHWAPSWWCWPIWGTERELELGYDSRAAADAALQHIFAGWQPVTTALVPLSATFWPTLRCPFPAAFRWPLTYPDLQALGHHFGATKELQKGQQRSSETSTRRKHIHQAWKHTTHRETLGPGSGQGPELPGTPAGPPTVPARVEFISCLTAPCKTPWGGWSACDVPCFSAVRRPTSPKPTAIDGADQWSGENWQLLTDEPVDEYKK